MGPVRVSVWVRVCEDEPFWVFAGGVRSRAREKKGCLGLFSLGQAERYWAEWVRVELRRDLVLIWWAG